MRRHKVALPTLHEVEITLNHMEKRKRRRQRACRLLAVLLVAASCAVLAERYVVCVVQVNGDSMAPLYSQGDIVLCLRTKNLEPQDIACVTSGNKILVKRVVATPGDTIDIDYDGTVEVNNKELTEPYVKEPALGKCDIDLPLKVPKNSYFLLGDNRVASVDSRSSEVGCIKKDNVMGRVLCVVWPLGQKF